MRSGHKTTRSRHMGIKQYTSLNGIATLWLHVQPSNTNFSNKKQVAILIALLNFSNENKDLIAPLNFSNEKQVSTSSSKLQQWKVSIPVIHSYNLIIKIHFLPWVSGLEPTLPCLPSI